MRTATSTLVRAGVWLAAGVATLAAAPLQAFNFNTNDPSFSVSWDNTLKYSTTFRLTGQSANLLGYADGQPAVNLDDGDRNFNTGLVSNRVDLLSEFELRKQFSGWNFGVRVSGDGWYDSVYNQSNDNNSPRTSNSLSVPHNQFPRDTRTIEGHDADLLDAFVFTRFHLGAVPVTTKLGRHALQYGQTLFFGANGIAVAQQPVDLIKLLSVPSSQFKEILLPVWQVSTQAQLSDKWSIGGYYQLKWRDTRLPAAGSYLSNADFVGYGAERLFLGPPLTPTSGPLQLLRGADIKAKDSGQFGLELRYTPQNYELGFYFAQYHAKDPQFYFVDSPNADPVGTGVLGHFVDVFPEDIRTAGIAISTNIGPANVAGEVSYRWNAPLVSDPQTIPVGAFADNSDHPAYAVGRTLHANVSAIYLLGPTPFWDGGSALGEIGWNMRTAIDRNPQALDPNTTKAATALRFIFSPVYYQVLSGVDINVPIGMGYNPFGRSSAVFNYNGGVQHGGDLSAGLGFVYKDVWFMDFNFVDYFGPSGPFLSEPDPTKTPVRTLTYKQSLSDRKFISIDFHHTF